MPPKGRKDPSLLVGPDGNPELTLPSPEELEVEQHTEAGEAMDQPTMIYEGEILSSAMTLAVVLPGDSKESYFRAAFTGRLQPGEDADNLAARTITVVRETVIGQMDDAIDALAEYGQQLANSGRLA